MDERNETMSKKELYADARKRKVCYACENPLGGWAGLSQWHNEYCKRPNAKGPMKKGKPVMF
tara:strand:- start:45 stop:230 length:186 start_codon:yes stop_codon:yes gene_type:complete